MHSSRMRTVRLPTVSLSLPTARCQYHEGRSLSEPVSTCQQWWPPDVRSTEVGPLCCCPGGGILPWDLSHDALPTISMWIDTTLWKQWRTRRSPPPVSNSFNFMRVLGQFAKIVCWRQPVPLPWRVGATTSGQSWIRHLKRHLPATLFVGGNYLPVFRTM